VANYVLVCLSKKQQSFVPSTENCTYRVAVTKSTMKHLLTRGGSLQLSARFNGNTALRPFRSKSTTVTTTAAAVEARAPECVDRVVRPPRSGFERAGQLAPAADPELAIDVAEVQLDRLGRHEQRLADRAVRLAGGGQPGHATLGGGQ
jgi:hypothetical protein